MKAIIHNLLCIALLCLLSSCRFSSERQEALSIVNQADSLFAAGNLYNDTIRLKSAIQTLEHSSRYDHNQLAHAYYYLGRNYDILHLDSKEVPCFFRCIELKPQNKTYIARSYFNLEKICSHCDEFHFASVFAYKAAWHFLAMKDTVNWVESMINYGSELINIGEETKGFETIISFKKYISDDFGLLKYNLILADYYCKKNDYDKAYNLIKDEENINTSYKSYECKRLLLLCNIYDKQNNIELLDSCLNKLFIISDGPTYISAAYDYIIKDSTSILLNKYGDIDEIIKAKNLRIVNNAEENKAAINIKNTMAMEKRRKVIFVFLSLLIILIAITYLIKLHKQRNYEKLLNFKKHTIENLKLTIERTKEQVTTQKMNIIKYHNTQRIQYIEKRCNEYKSISLPWNKYEIIKTTTNADFFNIVDKLENCKKLNHKEILLCIMVLIGYNKKYIADNLFMAENSVGKTKLRVAKKLNTTVAELPIFLKKMAADYILN